MHITFQARIKDLATKTLVSGDLCTRINLESDNLALDTKKALQALQHTNQSATGELEITISDGTEGHQDRE